MARMTVEEIYRGEKYDVMSAATADYLMNGRASEYDERTWLDMLLVKHALIAVEKMKSEGDTVSGIRVCTAFAIRLRNRNLGVARILTSLI